MPIKITNQELLEFRDALPEFHISGLKELVTDAHGEAVKGPDGKNQYQRIGWGARGKACNELGEAVDVGSLLRILDKHNTLVCIARVTTVVARFNSKYPPLLGPVVTVAYEPLRQGELRKIVGAAYSDYSEQYDDTAERAPTPEPEPTMPEPTMPEPAMPEPTAEAYTPPPPAPVTPPAQQLQQLHAPAAPPGYYEDAETDQPPF